MSKRTQQLSDRIDESYERMHEIHQEILSQVVDQQSVIRLLLELERLGQRRHHDRRELDQTIAKPKPDWVKRIFGL